MTNYWDYLAAASSGRLRRKSEIALALPRPPGTILSATDRDYLVMPSGQWVRRERAEEIPFKRSQIALPYPVKETDPCKIPYRGPVELCDCLTPTSTESLP